MRYAAAVAAALLAGLLAVPVTAASPVTVAVTADIACKPGARVTPVACQHGAVADLIESWQPDALLVPGDIQYGDNSDNGWARGYGAAFAGLRPVTFPVPGNHEYLASGIGGYTRYFDDPAPHWYSFDLGSWHVVGLVSACARIGGCGNSTAQATWLRADLAANPRECVAAFWHHPRFNSGEHPGASNMRWAWTPLANAGADLVLNGHEHAYQRFAPIDGITELVVGTGGKSHYTGGTTHPLTVVRDTSHFGALRLELADGGYTFEFIDTSGVVRDSGTGDCS